MRVTAVFLLVAALVTLPFTSASPANLALRQSPAIISCTQNADCKAAVSYWNDCQTATVIGLPQVPHSEQRNCLCETGQGASPFHPDWYSKLTSCIQCVDNASGFHNNVLSPLQALHVNFCSTGLLGYGDFVAQAHNIAANAGFPLQLPEAILVSTQSDILSVPPTPSATSSSKTCEVSNPGKTSTYTAQATTLSPVPVAQGCNYDNCLRQAIRSEDVVIPFCKAYTTAVQTSTAGYPTYVSMCNNQPKSISSACTCLLSAQTPTQSATSTQSQIPTQSHASSNGGIATSKPAPQPSTHYHTLWITTFFYTTRTEGGHSSTALGASSPSCTTPPGTSSTLPVVMSSSTTIPTKSFTSVGTSGSTMVQSPTPVSTMRSSSVTHSSTALGTLSTSAITKSLSVAPSPSTSSSTAPTSTTWVTLPASDGMKACAASKDCVTANSFYYQCLNAQSNGNQTGSWNCLCKTNFDGWKSSVLGCAACIAMNLPANPSGNAPSNELVSAMTTTVNFFCNQTNPAVLVQSMAGLDRVGLYLTNIYESPIDFFGMTLLDAPPASIRIPTSIVPSSTTTITTIVTVVPIPATTSPSSLVAPSGSGTSTGIHTTLSTQTTSASLITPTWITFPPTQAMLQCQAKDCQPAQQVFNGCIFIDPNTTNEGPIFDCFCTRQKDLWKSALSNCTKCIAAALPAHNPATGEYQATALNSQTEFARSLYCNQSELFMSTRALQTLGNFGNAVTTAFQLPINFFGMTLLPGPIVGKRNIRLQDFQT
ncbi:uncharacterized protein K444DRAFT_632634 [Hyaloscypha bicolor E]|uniref:Extracellular membrane protein CFEM domain-containing protein n=1 Tax=Hyaloscypha bicolor E TaxID=1095630 RepID=A0A2J6SZJ9_9HELO|nr:uncharacterized protein K444DRAFT_632634 [Hyaloscypha bicolor E]PMD56210.1 hypothetical protein K444DRAFT_632634 [Hyaloscypha bicolor E]